jgi:hypothetical protein
MAAKPDITTLTVPELLALRQEIDEAVAEKRELAMAELREDWEARAASFGVTLAEVAAGSRKRKPRAQSNGAHA